MERSASAPFPAFEWGRALCRGSRRPAAAHRLVARRRSCAVARCAPATAQRGPHSEALARPLTYGAFAVSSSGAAPGDKIPGFSRECWAFLGVSPQFSRESCGLFLRALLGLYEKSRRGGDSLPDAGRWARVCLSSSPPSRCHFRVDRRHFPAGTARPVPAARQKGWGSRQMRFSPSIDYKKRRLIT